MEHHINKFRKILVANRGEIAIRILRAASELKIETVAIYTYEDRYSLHRYKADESYRIGAEDDPLKPYLDIEAIIKIAKDHQIDAIHPGYGFLSENVNFARRCKEEGIVFVGPQPEVMERLGNKVKAKILARSISVPLIKDSGNIENEKALLQEAEKIGFPIMVKAAAGGGGRGMRVVRDAKDLLKAFHSAKGEAKTAFGDDSIFLEKFIENPKHIEIQLLGDHYGNVVHLFERDCSVQRRFQKVVEIAPAATLNQKTKDKLYEYALAIAKEVGYSNAGTVEFLVDQDEEIYFIEVNPRIQVEHTITETITGLDIVRTQFLVAMGHALKDPEIDIQSQEDISCNGFAIQCRVTTENPSDDFKPDYGTLIAYRSASGFGIRLDAGSAYAGAKISPFFDSMLVKVTGSGRTLEDAANRLHRALREFRVRGVSTNIGFLLRLLQNKTFTSGAATVNFIGDNQDLLIPPQWQDRGTKMLKYLAEVIVNGNPDVKFVNPKQIFPKAEIPTYNTKATYPKGTKDMLNELGRDGFLNWVKEQKSIQYTDTTFRDAHQSLLATRMRTHDLKNISESYAHHHAESLFSMEVWGGATFDVSLRFLKECPWKRLEMLRERIPNILFQMLLRGSNAVGYAAYPDNLVEKFIIEAWNEGNGVDVFRIFDSLNWVEAMKTSIRTVRNETGGLAEACICYTGDVSDKTKKKYSLQYYVDLAKQLEDEGAHLIAIKDMAGLLKPFAAEELIKALKASIDLPIHLHTHDTSSIQSTTYLKAIEAGVDIVDVALSSMSGLTSQPNFNSLVGILKGHEREKKVDLKSLNEFSNYWEAVRTYYYPFETELRAGSAQVYDHEIPGGQYSNLRPQARGLGLEDQFETIKENYKVANELFGDLIKVTPSSKVVGDMAMFMTSNGLTKEDVLNQGASLAFPDSVKALMRGDLGQAKGGFPEAIQKMVLKGEEPYTDKPNAHLRPINFEKELKDFKTKFENTLGIKDLLSYKLYPKVYTQYYEHFQKFGAVSNLGSPTFFYGLKPNEEIMVSLSKGKDILIKYLFMTEASEQGIRFVFFSLNGQIRSIEVKDNSLESTIPTHRKAISANEIGSPLQGSLSQILVKNGDVVEMNTPLFVIEAMKMESTITSTQKGVVAMVHLNEKTLVEQDDLVVELE